MTQHLAATEHVLRTAAAIAGVDVTGAEIIRDGSHVMYRLPGDIVARVGRPGTADTAEREVKISDWLAESGVTVTRTVDALAQPVIIDGRPVTWWRLLPEHRAATPAELGRVLRLLHGLPVPASLRLPQSNPFAGLGQRIDEAAGLDSDDKAWLQGHLSELREGYGQLVLGEPSHVLHGDAWQGNVAVPESGMLVLLDLEHVSVGNPDWDLVPLAVDHTDFARLDERDYRSFVEAYGGYDVTASSGFRVLADIQELRWVCFVASKSESSEQAKTEVRHRIACLRGEIPRPWSWAAF